MTYVSHSFMLEINKMMEELMTDEMKKLYDELSNLSKEMNKEDILEKLENIDFAQEDMLKELDRTIEHFKKMEIQQKAKDLSQELKELSEKQAQLKDKTTDKESSSFEKFFCPINHTHIVPFAQSTN